MTNWAKKISVESEFLEKHEFNQACWLVNWSYQKKKNVGWLIDWLIEKKFLEIGIWLIEQMLDQLRGGKLQFPISYFALCEKPFFFFFFKDFGKGIQLTLICEWICQNLLTFLKESNFVKREKIHNFILVDLSLSICAIDSVHG